MTIKLTFKSSEQSIESRESDFVCVCEQLSLKFFLLHGPALTTKQRALRRVPDMPLQGRSIKYLNYDNLFARVYIHYYQHA